MSGNMHRSAAFVCDGFDVNGDLVSLELLDIPKDSFIKTQYLGYEGCWLTRCLCCKDDELISLFYAEDHFVSDRGILIRKIFNAVKLTFYVDTGKHSIFNNRYHLTDRYMPLIRVTKDKMNAFILFTGGIKYDSYEGRMTLPEGEHEIYICEGNDPSVMMRNLNKLLNESAKRTPHAKDDLACALDTVYTARGYEKDFLYLYSLRKLGLTRFIPSYECDESSIIHGALPAKSSEDGSSIDTLYYICSKGVQAERCKGLFCDNFVRGNKIALNSHKRRANIRLPRFRYGLCPYCMKNSSWLEKTRHSTYACVDCFGEADLPSNIPDTTEYTSDLPLLVMIYLGIDIPVFEDIPSVLKDLSAKQLNAKMTALLLYALCIYGLEERHEVYKKLMSQRNDIGIWQEDSCSPTVNAICCASIIKYKNVL